MASTVAFTCCDESYEDFAPLFAFSTLAHNPDVAVELGVRDPEAFEQRQPGWTFVTELYPGRLLARPVSVDGALPHTVRFLETPVTPSEYVYLTDIDMIVLEAYVDIHLANMRKHGARYSNVVRPGTDRLSGLHFCERAAQYPLPDTSDLQVGKMFDERVLYEIVRRKGLGFYESTYRPQHGIHISPQRQPLDTFEDGRKIPGWGVNRWPDQYEAFSQTADFHALRPHLSESIRRVLDKIESALLLLQ